MQNLLGLTGLTAPEFDVIGSSEAFAARAQASAVCRARKLDPEELNPNGGPIARGRPAGATGASALARRWPEPGRIGGARALVTMCIGGGRGIALAPVHA